MRYVLLLFALSAVMVVAIAGKRGERSRRPPIEIFPDMDRQPKLRPQTVNAFFKDRLSSQLPVPGTVARGSPYEDNPVNTGRIPGTTNFVATIPVPVTAQLLARGQERFNINCAPCHGAAGDGRGVTTKYGMTTIADLHDGKQRKLIQQADGELFNTITYGKSLMGAYGANLSINDRWAVVAYVRALQRSWLGFIDDVPGPERAALKK